MRITDVRTMELHIPHLGGYRDATTRVAERGYSVLAVYVVTDQGIEGFAPGRGGPAARAIIEQTLKPLLIGRDPLAIERIWDDLFWRIRGIGRKGLAFCALSAVDIALWDLKARLLGLPLCRLLGGSGEPTPVYGSGGWTNLTVDELVEEMAGYVARGINAVKMKVGLGEDEDLLRVRSVREAIGEGPKLFLDVNGGYYAKQAIRMSHRFEEYNVGWLEEPVMADDLDGLAAVVQATRIPIATGEHEYTKYGFRDLMVRRAADIVQPNVTRVGGITEWLKIAHLAEAFNLPVAPHAAQIVHVHLARATPNLLTLEYLGFLEEADRILYADIPPLRDGRWAPALDRPGLGLELDPSAIKLYGS